MGGTRLFGLAVLIASILTILTPVSARASVTLLIAVRVAEGLVLVSRTLKLTLNTNSASLAYGFKSRFHVAVRLYSNRTR